MGQIETKWLMMKHNIVLMYVGIYSSIPFTELEINFSLLHSIHSINFSDILENKVKNGIN